MTNKELADLLMPDVDSNIEYYENLYKPRATEGIVTRFAPSPTGFVHMGSLLASFIENKAATDTNGVFYLRIEDTDQKREVENGVQGIIDDLNYFNIKIDEGVLSATEEKGEYGPYIQSKRKTIYRTYAKHLLEEGLAYPCFCTPEEIEETRMIQEKRKTRIGYYGRFAKCRKLTKEEIKEKVLNGEQYIIRFKSFGDYDTKIKIKDLVKGDLEFPENDMDIVIIKSDGLPTYHFAHAIDDHLMHTTHVIRGDEWVSSLPLHIQLFKTLGFEPPKYAHLSPIMKEEDGKRRKLSKRKDPEAAVSYYNELGIPVEAVKLYLMTVANSNFEEWYLKNPDGKLEDFKFDFKKISSSGALFDVEKLFNISKNYISRLNKTEVYDNLVAWTNTFDKEFNEILLNHKEYSMNVFNIEREQKKPRKDYVYYSDIKNQIWYMFDEYFNSKELEYDFQNISDLNEIKNILNIYIEKYYVATDDKDEWFNKIKMLSDELGYASDMKLYKENPDAYKGNVSDIATVIRVALTTKTQTPDLYEIMNLLGIERIKDRINKIVNK